MACFEWTGVSQDIRRTVSKPVAISHAVVFISICVLCLLGTDSRTGVYYVCSSRDTVDNNIHTLRGKTQVCGAFVTPSFVFARKGQMWKCLCKLVRVAGFLFFHVAVRAFLVPGPNKPTDTVRVTTSIILVQHTASRTECLIPVHI